MTTKAQIDANRLNAQKSTGPKTIEGKARVALNALKHGVRATALVASLQRTPLFDDDPREFADLVQRLVDQFQPEGPIEEACVEDIALCQCPSAEGRRVVIAETGHIASAQTILLSGPGADNPRLRQRNALPDFDSLERLNRYETSIQRQLKRSCDTLTRLIRDRHSNGRQSGSGAQTKQEADRGGELAAIRREVLGYLLDELGSNGVDPEIKSAVLAAQGPNESPLAPASLTIDENSNLREQSQITGPQPTAGPAAADQPAALLDDLAAGGPDADTAPESVHPETARTDPSPSTTHIVRPSNCQIQGRATQSGAAGAVPQRSARTKPNPSSARY